MNNVERYLRVETDFFNYGVKKHLLNEIQVFGHHYDHVGIPTFDKTLNGRFDLFIGYGMKAMPIGAGLLHKILQIALIALLVDT